MPQNKTKTMDTTKEHRQTSKSIEWITWWQSNHWCRICVRIRTRHCDCQFNSCTLAAAGIRLTLATVSHTEYTNSTSHQQPTLACGDSEPNNFPP